MRHREEVEVVLRGGGGGVMGGGGGTAASTTPLPPSSTAFPAEVNTATNPAPVEVAELFP
jgi:hypothetical protein